LGTLLGADEGVVDGLELDNNDGLLDGEVDVIAVGTLLGADEGVVDGLELGANDQSLDGEVDGIAFGTILGHYWVQMRVWWMSLNFVLMIGHLMEKLM